MRNLLSLRSLLLVLFLLPILSCEVEPLKGEFPQTDPNTAEEGQFIAKIAGQDFVADEVQGTLNEDNQLTISGVKANGETIMLGIENPDVGSFNLTTTELNQNAGIYIDGGNTFPYATAGVLGGSGQIQITEFDTENNTITGTFSFIAVRMKIGDDGLPVLDGSGSPILENIEITNGAFNQIPFVNDGTGGGDPGGGDPDNEFFAKVDGEDFIAESISVSEPIIGDVHMYKIEARTASRELIRIDIPRSLGVGTFNMESLSDGTKLIGLYKEGSGSGNLTSNPGTITITEFNLIEGVLKAEFAFTAKDPLGADPRLVQITEGSFTVHFEGIPHATPMFKTRVDGVEFNPEDFTNISSVVNQYPRVTITAQINNQEIELGFPTTFLEGTYDFGSEVVLGNEVVGTYVPVVGTSIRYVSEGGSLVINSYDLETGIIEGTFNFTASDPSGQDPTVYQITAGEFLIIL